MHQCFIQIYDHTDLPLVLRGHCWQQTLSWCLQLRPEHMIIIFYYYILVMKVNNTKKNLFLIAKKSKLEGLLVIHMLKCIVHI